jgi:hypothetical protein
MKTSFDLGKEFLMIALTGKKGFNIHRKPCLQRRAADASLTYSPRKPEAFT